VVDTKDGIILASFFALERYKEEVEMLAKQATCTLARNKAFRLAEDISRFIDAYKEEEEKGNISLKI